MEWIGCGLHVVVGGNAKELDAYQAHYAPIVVVQLEDGYACPLIGQPIRDKWTAALPNEVAKYIWTATLVDAKQAGTSTQEVEWSSSTNEGSSQSLGACVSR
jgi:hypothetical protein